MTMPDSVHNAQTEYRRQVRRWRTLGFAMFLAMSLTLVLFLIIRADSHTIRTDIKAAEVQREAEIRELTRVAEKIESATGTEAQTRQRAAIQQILVTIDCNNREALQEVIDSLDLKEGVTVLTPECATTDLIQPLEGDAP